MTEPTRDALHAETLGEPVPSFWAVLRDDNETMATGKTHDEAVREFMRYRGGDYANAVKEGYRCVAIFTKWPTHPAPSGGEELTETQRVAIALMGDCWLARSLQTPEQLRDHYIEYGRQEAEAAAPRPEPGEPSEAMVEVMARAVAQAVDGPDAGWGIWADLLRAALAAQREPRP